MAYEFKRLSEVEALAEVPEGANALIEVDGSIKRVPGSGLGGGSTLVVTGSDFTNAVAGVSTLVSDGSENVTYTANMTLKEALTTFRERKLVGGFVYISVDGTPSMMSILILSDETSYYFKDCLFLLAMSPIGEITLYWTADGISTEEPQQPK